MSLIEKIDELSTIQLNSADGPMISKKAVKELILSEQKEPCEWIQEDEDSNTWECSKCGALWVLNSGTPKDNDMKFCPVCGSPIQSPNGET